MLFGLSRRISSWTWRKALPWVVHLTRIIVLVMSTVQLFQSVQTFMMLACLYESFLFYTLRATFTPYPLSSALEDAKKGVFFACLLFFNSVYGQQTCFSIAIAILVWELFRATNWCSPWLSATIQWPGERRVLSVLLVFTLLVSHLQQTPENVTALVHSTQAGFVPNWRFISGDDYSGADSEPFEDPEEYHFEEDERDGKFFKNVAFTKCYDGMVLASNMPEESPQYNSFNSRLLRSVRTGDTCTVELTTPSQCQLPKIFRTMSVRVYGIDTPEIKGKCKQEKDLALKAKAATIEWVVGRGGVDLHGVKKDKYFRIGASVEVKGKGDLAEMLLSRGLAKVYHGGKKDPNAWC